MNRLLNSLLLLIALVPISCKKDHASIASTHRYKITLVSGGGQSDTIGNGLKEYIFFKLTYDDDTLSNGFIRFQVYNCDNNLQSTQIPIGKNAGNSVLQISYYWRLNSTIGTQSLKAILLDSLERPQDSVVVNATGIAPGRGWYSSGCLPLNPSFAGLALQPTGRVLGFYRTGDYPYYSDDEGITWHKLTTFQGNYAINNIITTPANEIFIFVPNTGVFYSADGGQSWEKRISGLTIDNLSQNLQYTKSGKLLLPTFSGLFISADKGLSWHLANAPGPYGGFSNTQSMSNGTLIAISDHHLFKSTDGGENWADIWSTDAHHMFSLFIDDNDDLYSGEVDGIYVSKDTGQTWNKFYQSDPIPNYAGTVTAITKQNGAYYFYATEKNLLMHTFEGVHFDHVTFPLGDNYGRESFCYILSANNHVIVSNEQYGLFYFIP